MANIRKQKQRVAKKSSTWKSFEKVGKWGYEERQTLSKLCL